MSAYDIGGDEERAAFDAILSAAEDGEDIMEAGRRTDVSPHTVLEVYDDGKDAGLWEETEDGIELTDEAYDVRASSQERRPMDDGADAYAAALPDVVKEEYGEDVVDLFEDEEDVAAFRAMVDAFSGGGTRADVVEELGWPKSRVDRTYERFEEAGLVGHNGLRGRGAAYEVGAHAEELLAAVEGADLSGGLSGTTEDVAYGTPVVFPARSEVFDLFEGDTDVEALRVMVETFSTGGARNEVTRRLGWSRSQVNRVFDRFEEAGLVRYNGKSGRAAEYGTTPLGEALVEAAEEGWDLAAIGEGRTPLPDDEAYRVMMLYMDVKDDVSGLTDVLGCDTQTLYQYTDMLETEGHIEKKGKGPATTYHVHQEVVEPVLEGTVEADGPVDITDLPAALDVDRVLSELVPSADDRGFLSAVRPLTEVGPREDTTAWELDEDRPAGVDGTEPGEHEVRAEGEEVSDADTGATLDDILAGADTPVVHAQEVSPDETRDVTRLDCRRRLERFEAERLEDGEEPTWMEDFYVMDARDQFEWMTEVASPGVDGYWERYGDRFLPAYAEGRYAEADAEREAMAPEME